MKIGIVTDSTADLPQELVGEYNIEVIPLQVIIDGLGFRDGVDLSRDEFYEKISTPGINLPSTSQPSPGIFIETYRRLLEKFDTIISIHISNKLSGTVQTAQLASEMFSGKVRVIDSLSTSMGLGSLVLEAARGLKRGMKFEKVVEMVYSLREQINFLVLLDTLKFVRHGGRVSSLQLFLGSVLKIKPLLRINHGEVEAAGKARNRKEAITLLMEKFKEQIGMETRSIISVVHTKAKTEALKLKAIIEETFKNAEVILNQAGPALGSHAGPGALALISLPKN
jgi:DegV family protein with EDD domain